MESWIFLSVRIPALYPSHFMAQARDPMTNGTSYTFDLLLQCLSPAVGARSTPVALVGFNVRGVLSRVIVK